MIATARVNTEWQALGAAEPGALVDARHQLHHAVQVIVAASISYLTARPDDSHTSLEWVPELQGLVTRALPGSDGLRFGLRPGDLTLFATGARTFVHSSFALHGRTGADALDWLRGELREAGFDLERLTTNKHYAIPSHPVAHGAAFDAAPVESFTELARCYQDGWIVASRVSREHAGASEPRGWPHHFDLATLVSLPLASRGTPRTIGVGLSPGDASYAEPYFYVAPYPRPPREALPPLGIGHWHTDDWIGAVLTASNVAQASREVEPQRVRTHEFVRIAMLACRVALGDTGR